MSEHLSQASSAIDFYSGVGGWSYGLQLAGIQVVASYEISEQANLTNRMNNGHAAYSVDIRSMDVDSIPSANFLVGSPPCTQFSTSNRGGGGDISDGLRDVARFLELVERLNPKGWAMENVPRLKSILDSELRPGGSLERFLPLNVKYRVFDLHEFGLPQRRRRCIVGNVDFDLLESYKGKVPTPTLGDIVSCLKNEQVNDPNYALSCAKDELVDHQLEEPLSCEEMRINRSAKVLHTIYNAMQFPDPLHHPARTITATCTRVSRESIVIFDPDKLGQCRRLSVRERACAQGFPISYQFFGKSYTEKLKMVGNAMPPVFAYYLGHALLGTPCDRVLHTSQLRPNLPCRVAPLQTPPHKVGRKFPAKRAFKFAIPSLRLGSGVRFELANSMSCNKIEWLVNFVYGTPKNIQRIKPSRNDVSLILAGLPIDLSLKIYEIVHGFCVILGGVDVEALQSIWNHSIQGDAGPFDVLDIIDSYGALVASQLSILLEEKPEIAHKLLNAVLRLGADNFNRRIYSRADVVIAGIIVAGCVNDSFYRNEGVTEIPIKNIVPAALANYCP